MQVTVDRLAWFAKEELGSSGLNRLRAELLVKPRKVGDYPGDPPEPIELWSETNNHFGVPREFFLRNRTTPHDITYSYTMGAEFPSPLAFVGELRDGQRDAHSDVVCAFAREDCTGGLVKAAPGWGKTVWGCALIAALDVPTLVIVHKEFLMSQWRERIAEYLPEAKVGHVQEGTCDFEGKHVVLTMIHSLAGRRYPAELYRWPGLLISDECHRTGAETWSPVLPMFPARWRVGLSATPRRKDGAENVFRYHIGPVLYSSLKPQLKIVVKRVWTDFRVVSTPRFNPALAPRSLLIKLLVASVERTRRVAGQIVAAAEAGRKILVLSEQLKHLDALCSASRALWGKGTFPSVGFYVGGKKREEYKEAAEAQIVFATSQYAKEGLDIPALDTLVLATPMSDVEQAVGRIQRSCEGKKDPIVVDIRDDHIPMFLASAKARERFYAQVS